MENKLFQVSLKIILKNEEGEILVLKTREESSLFGFYDLPGGRIKEDEIETPFEEILAREIAEELGENVEYEIKIKPVAIARHASLSGQLFWVFFEALYKKGEIKISAEHSGYRWEKLNGENLERFFIKGSLEGMRNYFNDLRNN